MGAMDTAPFREKLVAEKVKLEKELDTVGRKHPGVPGEWDPVPSETGAEPDLVDQADMHVSQESNAAILVDLEARYDEVTRALARIDAGTYGICEIGGEPIEEARLNADPAAATCTKHLR